MVATNKALSMNLNDTVKRYYITVATITYLFWMLINEYALLIIVQAHNCLHNWSAISICYCILNLNSIPTKFNFYMESFGDKTSPDRFTKCIILNVKIYRVKFKILYELFIDNTS